MCGIYKIENTVNGDYYYGSTADSFAQRFSNHKSQLRLNKHSNPRLQRSWNKHGSDSFVFKIVSVCENQQDSIITEQKYLDAHVGQDKCCNFLPRAGTTAGKVLSEVAKKRIARSKSTKQYRLIDPAGKIHRTKYLVPFSLKHGLDFSAMYKLVSGKLKTHHGWRKAGSHGKSTD